MVSSVLAKLECLGNSISDYRRLTNSYLAALSVSDDVILYKELDTLCDLALLEKSPSFTGQLAFRKTSLQVVLRCILRAFS